MDELRKMMIKANEELKDERKMEKFKDLREKLTDGVYNGEIEPYNAYLEFLHEINKIYPNATKYYGTEHFEGKLRTFILMHLLKIIGEIQRNHL